VPLIILTYHRITDRDNGLSAIAFTNHLTTLVAHYPLCPPHTPIPKGSLGVYLTFDDATFDFYHFVYPLLKRLNICAMLAIPTKAILETSNMPITHRLQTVASPYKTNGSDHLCTWSEIREMVASGHVTPASHSCSHPNLTHRTVPLETELLDSRAHLEDQLNCAIDTFIYPYGQRNYRVDRKTLQHYRYAMRMGNALHPLDWPEKGLLYRVNIDPHQTILPFFSPAQLNHYHLNYWLNRLRFR